jgi:hypothetical protein
MARRTDPSPAVPGKVASSVTKHSKPERVRDCSTEQTRSRTVDCWDMQGRADGVLSAKRFRRAGLARTWKERLDAGSAARGWALSVTSGAVGRACSVAPSCQTEPWRGESSLLGSLLSPLLLDRSALLLLVVRLRDLAWHIVLPALRFYAAAAPEAGSSISKPKDRSSETRRSAAAIPVELNERCLS